MDDYNFPDNASVISNSSNRSRKRSLNLNDEDSDGSRTQKSDYNKRQNHSEIEKRRRDKMNTYITELSSLIPMGTSRKLDKLTVLRMAVQHMKMFRGSFKSYTEGHYKPSFLSDEELKHLILQAADGFLFVVGCDRGRILYVSETVSQTLHYSQSELLGTSWFDILHPKDLSKVKEQLSSSDISRRERLVDAKTLLPVKTDIPQSIIRLCPGSRRSFFCRIRCKQTAFCKEEADTTTGCSKKKSKLGSERKYCIIHFTGYLKSWAPTKDSVDEETDIDSCNLSCLVAVGRVHHPLLFSSPSDSTHLSRSFPSQPIEYTSKHNNEGKFVFIDPKCSLLVQWLPQELLGTSMYEYFHVDDISYLTEVHRMVLQQSDPCHTQVYRFRTKNGSFLQLQSTWKSFKNPWTKEIEYIISRNYVILSQAGDVGSTVTSECVSSQSYNNMGEMFSGQAYESNSAISSSRVPSNGLQAGKIGRKIVEEVFEGREKSTEPNSFSGMFNTFSTETSADEQSDDSFRQGNIENVEPVGVKKLKNRIVSNSIKSVHCSGSSSGNQSQGFTSETETMESSRPEGTSDSDEAAMAVLMSLLEAESGLGGPVDFSHLPWPLP